ncbi:MAG: HAD-IA family hydrolase [Prochloraceae cyanobacterium]
MGVKVIIFDFDGTIADTYDTLFDICNRLSGEFGYKPLDRAKISQLRELSSREIIKQAEISLFKVPILLKRVKEELNQEIANVKPITGIEPILLALKEKGYNLGIITSNIETNVLAFLKKHNYQELFNFIYSGTTIFGKHKVIDRCLDRRNLNRDRVIYIGDETRDIKAAKRSKIKIISVGWGFNCPSVLAQYQPDFLIEHPRELIKAIENLDEILNYSPLDPNKKTIASLQ